MRIPGPSRWLRVRLMWLSPSMAPSQLRTFRLAWWALGGGSARTAAGRDATVRQPAAGTCAGIVAVQNVTQPPVGLSQHQALSAPQPAATAPGPAPDTRVRVVLLPHARIKPTDTQANSRRTGKVTGIHQGDSSRQQSTQSDGATGMIDVNGQWHDAELAMKVARHSFQRWLVAGHEDTPASVITHAHHTQTALYEAVRAITLLIDTFHTETTALIHTPARNIDIPTPDHPIAENAPQT